jgi:hypothetical protein
VAQTKRKRRRKHRGTQGGRIDTRPKGRPRNRAEAKQRAASRKSGSGKSGSGKRAVSQPRGHTPPTWGSAAKKGGIAAAIFFALIALVFGRPIPSALALAGFMVLFYIPMAYYTDRFFYQRELRKQAQERAAGSEGSG